LPLACQTANFVTMTGAGFFLLAALLSLENLAEAARSYSQGNFARCLELSQTFSFDDSLPSQAAQLLAGQCAFYSGHRARAEAIFRKLAERYPHGPFRRLARLRAEDCRDPRAPSAITIGEAQSGFPDLITDPAPIVWKALNEKSRFATVMKLLRLAPRHPLTEQALAELPLTDLTTQQLLRLGRALKDQRFWPQARQALTLALGKSGGRLSGLALLERGLTAFDAKDYQAARYDLERARELLSGSEKEKAWLFYSRALGRSGDEVGAVASHLELAGAFPASPAAAQALYYAGWLSLHHKKHLEAEKIFERLLQQYPTSPFAAEAAWFAAWCRIGTGDWKGALEKLQAVPPCGTPAHSRQLYWKARALAALGNNTQLRSTLDELCSRDPFGWYAQLARLRFSEIPCPLPEKIGFEPPDISADDTLQDALTIKKAGLDSWARQALYHYEKQYLKNHPGNPGRRKLALAWFILGDCHRGWRLSGSLGRGEFSGWWEYLTYTHPDCYDESVSRESAGDFALKAFMLAVMRTESGFSPAAHSWADARGLVQLIPPVAEKAAAALNLDFSPEQLFEPELNLRLGAQVIKTLAERFQRRWWLMAAAYNSSPEKVEEWLGQPAALDAWVEQIPWQETREYVKSVLSSMAVYLWRYDAGVQPLKGTALD